MATGMRKTGEEGGVYTGKDKRAATLVRSLSVLDEWLDENEGRTDNEARVVRIKRWREEALKELEFRLNPARP